jgi:hypothetical protein
MLSLIMEKAATSKGIGDDIRENIPYKSRANEVRG